MTSSKGRIAWRMSLALALVTIACGKVSPDSSEGSVSGGSSGFGGSASGAGTRNASTVGGTHDGAFAGSSDSANTGAGSRNTAGGENGAGDTAGTGSAQDGGETGAGAGGPGSVTLTPGTCGIYRRILLPIEFSEGFSTGQVGASATRNAVQRSAGGFWTAMRANMAVHWLRIDADQTQTLYQAGFSSLGVTLELANVGTPERIVEIGTVHGSPYYSSVVDAGATDAVWVTTLSKYYYDFRAVTSSAISSLDGQRAVLMVSHIAGTVWSMVLGADGVRIGDVLEMTNTGSCYALLPTDRAGAFCFVDVDQTFHFLEMSAEGKVTRDIPIQIALPPTDQPKCPLLTLTEEGFALLSYDPATAWNLHRVARDGGHRVEVLGELSSTPTAFTVQGDTVLLLSQQANGGLITRRTPGNQQAFAIETFGKWIPAEPGALFVESRPRSADLPREISELRCLN